MGEDFKVYIGSKIILARPMTKEQFNSEKDNYPAVPTETPGYKVQYPDGYQSWSPKVVFEEAYRIINPAEKEMCK